MNGVVDEVQVCGIVVSQTEGFLEGLTCFLRKPQVSHAGVYEEVCSGRQGLDAPLERVGCADRLNADGETTRVV